MRKIIIKGRFHIFIRGLPMTIYPISSVHVYKLIPISYLDGAVVEDEEDDWGCGGGGGG